LGLFIAVLPAEITRCRRASVNGSDFPERSEASAATRWNCNEPRQSHQLFAAAVEQWTVREEERANPPLHELREGRIDLVFVAGVQEHELRREFMTLLGGAAAVWPVSPSLRATSSILNSNPSHPTAAGAERGSCHCPVRPKPAITLSRKDWHSF